MLYPYFHGCLASPASARATSSYEHNMNKPGRQENVRFFKERVPSDKTGAAWPIFNAAGQIMSLHANDRSFVLSTEMFEREHNCKFWEENER